jgi:m7GpppX diphosphatase
MSVNIFLNDKTIEIIDKKLEYKNDTFYRYSCKCIVNGVLIENSFEDNKNIKKIKLESYDDYLKLNIKNFNKTWIYNIIDHIEEFKNIIFEDNNIIIIPDYKWTGDIDKLHILGIFKDKTLYSIRELEQKHIKILEESLIQGFKIINEIYKIESDNLVTYFHYHPSVWQLHIHFNILENISKSSMLPRAHSVNNVIENLKIDSNYYKKIKLEIIE